MKDLSLVEESVALAPSTVQQPVEKREDADRCFLEVNLEAVRANALAARACVPGDAPAVMAVVKASAYGLGAAAVARTLAGVVRVFGVANLREARELRAAGVTEPVYILGPALPSERGGVVAGGFCAAVSNPEEVRAFGALARAAGKKQPVHAVLDTGMGRMGALPDEAPALLRAVAAEPFLILDSVASHFPCADEDPDFTRAQERLFLETVAALRADGLDIPLTHICNSAGITGFPRSGGPEMVRAGLMLYGISPLPEHQDKLRPVVTWKTRVAMTRELPAGWGVSYGRSFITPKSMRVATLSAGYADGYPRQVSGKGACVLIRGQRCPLLGRITMDQMMVDISALPPDVAPGEEAILLGRDPETGEEISANELAALAGTISWDILTGVGGRVTRRYL